MVVPSFSVPNPSYSSSSRLHGFSNRSISIPASFFRLLLIDSCFREHFPPPWSQAPRIPVNRPSGYLIIIVVHPVLEIFELQAPQGKRSSVVVSFSAVLFRRVVQTIASEVEKSISEVALQRGEVRPTASHCKSHGRHLRVKFVPKYFFTGNGASLYFRYLKHL